MKTLLLAKWNVALAAVLVLGLAGIGTYFNPHAAAARLAPRTETDTEPADRELVEGLLELPTRCRPCCRTTI